MTSPVFGEDGKPVRLANRIGKGGEGEVYAIDGRTDVALKLYTVGDAHTRENKIRLMVSERLSEKSPLVAFPTALIFNNARKFAGFLMPLVSGHQPLHELYSPGARKVAFPQASYRFLVLSAANIARAIGSTHSANCVVGDINHSGILVSSQAKVSLIDADSFQVSDGRNYFHCKVGVPEYTPPELQRKHLAGIVRTTNHDAFGLAVVIFQLLFMGRHPFSGKYASGEMPLERAIGEYRFAYSNKRSVGMVPPPGVPTLNDFPASIGAAFEAAFSAEGVNGRPTAKHWVGLLDELRDSLRVCAVSSLHHYSSAASECPWCRMEKRFAVPLFLPVIPTFDPKSTFNITAGDVESIWRATEAVRAPPNVAFPHLVGIRALPSAKAEGVSRSRTLRKWGGWILIASAVLVLFNYPSVWFLSILGAGTGWKLLTSKLVGDEEAIQNYRGAQTRVYQAEADWQQKSSGSEFAELKASLRAKRQAYEALPHEQKRRLDEYQLNRKSEQLNQYLQTFLIRKYKIPQVGQGRLANLISYGVETAADVTEAKVLRVTGFGPKTAKPLLNWRRHIEARFVYNTAPTLADNAAANVIKADIARRAVELKSDLSTGPAKLTQLAAAITARQQASLPFIEALLKQHAQAKVDIEALGLKLPDVARPPNIARPVPPVAPSQVAQSGGGVKCPNCGGGMVIRVATRGVHRGNRFYGCVRYPACKGIRQYP